MRRLRHITEKRKVNKMKQREQPCESEEGKYGIEEQKEKEEEEEEEEKPQGRLSLFVFPLPSTG